MEDVTASRPAAVLATEVAAAIITALAGLDSTGATQADEDEGAGSTQEEEVEVGVGVEVAAYSTASATGVDDGIREEDRTLQRLELARLGRRRA